MVVWRRTLWGRVSVGDTKAEGGIDGGVRCNTESVFDRTLDIKYLLCANTSTHCSLERHKLANVGRRNRSLSLGIILTLHTLGHPYIGVSWLLVYSKIVSKTHCRR